MSGRIAIPKFVSNENGWISLVDKQRGRADMTVEEFNRFVRAIKSGEIKEQGLTSLRRK